MRLKAGEEPGNEAIFVQYATKSWGGAWERGYVCVCVCVCVSVRDGSGMLVGRDKTSDICDLRASIY